MKHGFLLIDKPIGPTSHDVVQMVRNVLHEPKAGHLGTLDPFASGLLVMAVGAKALKVIEFFNELTKEYEAEITFGAVSSTYDVTGVIEKVADKPGWTPPEIPQLRNLLADRFIGKIQQVPPAFSAVHINGERAHVLARRGEKPVMPTRTVDVSACEIVSYNFPTLTLRVACSSGTYIRSLASDLGELLHTGAYLSNLRRTKVGDWSVEHAVKPEDANWTNVTPLKDIMKNLPSIEVNEEQATAIKMGKKIPLEIRPDTIAWFDDLPIAVLVPSRDGSQTAHARKVL